MRTPTPPRWRSADELEQLGPHDLGPFALGVLELDRPLAVELVLRRGPSGVLLGEWRNERGRVMAVVAAGRG